MLTRPNRGSIRISLLSDAEAFFDGCLRLLIRTLRSKSKFPFPGGTRFVLQSLLLRWQLRNYCPSCQCLTHPPPASAATGRTSTLGLSRRPSVWRGAPPLSTISRLLGQGNNALRIQQHKASKRYSPLDEPPACRAESCSPPASPPFSACHSSPAMLQRYGFFISFLLLLRCP